MMEIDEPSPRNGRSLESPRAQAFHRFPQLPPVIRRMIWKEFYLIPRHFLAHWEGYEDLIGNDTILLSWDLYPVAPGGNWNAKSYYYSIDNTIDRMSRSVARSLRKRFGFPTYRRKNLEPWSITQPPQQGSRSDVMINWEVDFINLNKETPQVDLIEDLPHLQWLRYIENIVVETWFSECKLIIENMNGLTSENKWLLEMRHWLPNLKLIQREFTNRAPVVLNEWAFFQTSYLLREAEDTPPSWRHTRQVATDLHWQSWISSPKTPQWTYFLERLQSTGVEVRDVMSQEIELYDEVLGSRRLFQGLGQIEAKEWDS
ncbi:hypothetical protein CGMCC3_g13073 [Colletotrichum fructicola]|uniref:2EXR domain-containing protein n=1 Tax=Colletotrichum fructicola (strain Nara gc5) TaxID=1213859 RepID=L2FVP6_COLFN|nr:uncharacterized protein CGMCC3_g13073 [Colletotrichum fructicola]KAE9570868.1 hypothetical protein CGMCC3_g13073 [Colletotrichum fructicola]KAF4481223.1 hypothetical protein CGGC5_v010605 [Colletotrichum fructicola Nara gc5]KAF4896626.1 hypothetical protein CGCFRS4_v005389 [Colletotrichum fructicola]